MSYRRLETRILHAAHTPLRVGVALALAAALMIPTLFSGFMVDDYMHLLTLRGDETVATPLDLFCFAPGNAEALYPFLNKGPLPWYTLPELKLHLFRPLSSATMALDHYLFGEFSFAYHVHSLLWYVLLAWAVFLLFRRNMTGTLAGLCCLLYIVDDGHIIPAMWWSNRNAIVAAMPAILGLVAHQRWRESHWRPGLPLSLLGYGLGLLGGETALGIFGYLIAYELVRADGPWRQRVRALAPAGMLAVGYLAVYKAANFGVHGLGIYLDPISEWPDYLRALPERFAQLIGAQFFALPAELAILSDRFRAPLLIVSIGATALLATGLYQLWRRCSADERQLLIWMGLGSFIASLPVLATFPSGRLLVLPSIGGAVWIGLFIAKGLDGARAVCPRLLRGLGRAFLLLHLVAMPAYWVGASIAMPLVLRAANQSFQHIDLDDDLVAEQQIICIFGPDPYSGLYPAVVRQYLGYPPPLAWRTLSLAPFDHEITRTSVNQFEVRIIGGELLFSPFERLLRSPKHPLLPGDLVALNGCAIEVLACGEWGPSTFKLSFEHPLEDPRYHFIAWREGGLRRIDWFPVGESRRYLARDGQMSWSRFKKSLPLL